MSRPREAMSVARRTAWGFDLKLFVKKRKVSEIEGKSEESVRCD